MTRIVFLLSAVLAATLFLAGCPSAPQGSAVGGGQRSADAPAGYAAPEGQVAMIPAPAPMPSAPLPAAPTWRPAAGREVILDPGHGGNNFGAHYFGLMEKDVNLLLAKRTAALLQAQGVVVHLTRQNDVFIPLADRSAYANKRPNALFVSIHCNASDKNPQASGVETYVLSKQFSDDEQCRRALARYNITGRDKTSSRQDLERLTRVCRAEGPTLADTIQKTLVARIGGPDRGVKTANLAVLRETFFCPAVLVEVGFISHYPTAQKMATAAWRDQTAQALAQGIVVHLQRGG